MKRFKILSTVVYTLLMAFMLYGCAERNDAVGPGSNALALISRTPVQGTAKAVTVVNNHAYVADEPFGVSIYDVSNPANPQLMDSFSLLNSLEATLITVDSTERIAVVQTDGELQVWDLEYQAFLFTRGTSGHTRIDIKFEEGILKLFRIDVGELYPFNYEEFTSQASEDTLKFSPSPSFTTQYADNYSVVGYGVGYFNRAYVCRDDAGFAIVNYSFGGNALVLGEANTIGKIKDAAITNANLLCLAAGYEGIVTVNVNDPEDIQVLGSLAISNATDIKWVRTTGHTAILLDNFDGAFAVDISNAAKPVLIGELRTSDPNGFELDGNYVYIADEDMGLVIGQLVN